MLNLSKFLERCLCKKLYTFYSAIQISERFQCFILYYQTNRKMETMFGPKGLVFVVLLTTLSKAFDSFSHEALAAKLNAYGL